MRADLGTNTYLIGTGKRRLLIDTGEGIPAYESLLSSVLRSEDCTIGPVLLTHWHPDHVGGVDQVSKLCPHATFSKYLHDDKGEYYPIRDGDEFAVEGGTVRAVHTPGHTTDHMAFYMSDTGILFTGDSILGQGTAVFQNLITYIASLKKQLSFKPTSLYPAHGPVVVGEKAAREKILEYIDHRQQREDEIVRITGASDVPVSPMDIVKVIYSTYPQSLWAAAERGVILHMEKLRDEGKAEEVERGKWVLVSSNQSR